jgi:hypothetical protein
MRRPAAATTIEHDQATMKSDRNPASNYDVRWTHADFELAAALKDATDVPEAPASLYRQVPWRRSAGVLGGIVVSALMGAWAFANFLYPPELVRAAMVHEHREATLRGDFQPDKGPMFAAMGLHAGATLPGLTQLQRPCDIDGHIAYHITTFLEQGGGMVTILAFEQALPNELAGKQGSWMGRYWRFAQGAPGKTVLLLADNARALAETERLLKSS